MTKYYDNPSYDAAFDRCISLMADMMVKHGPKVLKEYRQQMEAARYSGRFPMRDRGLLLRRMQRYQVKYQHLKIPSKMQ